MLLYKNNYILYNTSKNADNPQIESWLRSIEIGHRTVKYIHLRIQVLYNLLQYKHVGD
jgi:hypothetical protein